MADITTQVKEDTYFIAQFTSIVVFGLRFRNKSSWSAAFIPGRLAANGLTLETRSVHLVPDNLFQSLS